MSHNRKKDVARSKVGGVEIVFDHLQLASILGIPRNNGICEYIKEVWEESRYTKPLEITRKFANDDTIMGLEGDTTNYMDLIYMDHLIARRLVNLPSGNDEAHELCHFSGRTMSSLIVIGSLWFLRSSESLRLIRKEKNQRGTIILRTFFSPCVSRQEKMEFWWIGTGENRRRDDEIEPPAEEVHEEEVRIQCFDWEVVVDEVAVRGESGSDDLFFDAQVDVEEPVTEAPTVQAFPASPGDSTNQQKKQTPAGIDPSGPSGYIPDSVFLEFQAEFERARAERIQADLEKAQAENARLLALLQQARNPPKP
ncbi:hypothetical protein Dimus_032315 [Dionaea muscipula]